MRAFESTLPIPLPAAGPHRTEIAASEGLYNSKKLLPVLLVRPPRISFYPKRLPRPLPIELHDHILQYIVCHTDKYTLSSCALTCRYWLKRCGPTLFRSVVLPSLRDLDNLVLCLSIQSNIVGPILRFTQVLVIYQDGSVSPWGHLVALRLSHKLRNLRELHFAKWNRFYPDTRCPTTRMSSFSPHPIMPKALGSFLAPFSSLKKLCLHDYRFHSISDLLRLCSKLRELTILQVERLTWANVPRELPWLPRTGHRLRCLEAFDCAANWPFLWLWAGPKLVSVSASEETFPGFTYDDARVVGEIGRLCVPHLMPQDVRIECRASFSPPGCKQHIINHIVLLMTDRGVIGIITVHSVYLGTQVIQLHTRSCGSLAVVTQIIFVNLSPSAARSSLDSTGLNEQLTRLPFLETIIFDDDDGFTTQGPYIQHEVLQEYCALFPGLQDKLTLDQGGM